MAERVSMRGTHKARAKESALGVSEGNDPKEYIGVLFEITAGEFRGRSISRRFFFTSGAVEHTLKSLRHCGWSGETLADMSGLGDQEVELVIESETRGDRTYDNVKYVNRPARLVVNKMSDETARRFAETMSRLTVDSKRSYGPMPAMTKPGHIAGAPRPAAGDSSFNASPADTYEGPVDDDDIPF